MSRETLVPPGRINLGMFAVKIGSSAVFARGTRMRNGREIPADGGFEGHERAFRRAFVRHYPAVRRLLAHVTRDRNEAEDLAQEVFFALWHHRFEPEREHDLRRWLMRVALNRGLNAIRSGRRREARQDRQRRDAHGEVYDLEADVAQREVQRGVRAVLAALDPRAAQLLMLQQLGMSHAEIAEIVDVAPGSVGTLLTRAKRAFLTAYKRKNRRDTEETSS